MLCRSLRQQLKGEAAAIVRATRFAPELCVTFALSMREGAANAGPRLTPVLAYSKKCRWQVPGSAGHAHVLLHEADAPGCHGATGESELLIGKAALDMKRLGRHQPGSVDQVEAEIIYIEDHIDPDAHLHERLR